MVLTFVEVAAVILAAVILMGVAPAVANDSGPEGAAPGYSRRSD